MNELLKQAILNRLQKRQPPPKTDTKSTHYHSVDFQSREKDNKYKIVLKQLELIKIRNQSLTATRRGDFMGVAVLTTKAQILNREILELQIGINDNFVSY